MDVSPYNDAFSVLLILHVHTSENADASCWMIGRSLILDDFWCCLPLHLGFCPSIVALYPHRPVRWRMLELL